MCEYLGIYIELINDWPCSNSQEMCFKTLNLKKDLRDLRLRESGSLVFLSLV